MILFTTIVGSRMWKMERPDSDTDTFSVFIEEGNVFFRKYGGEERLRSHENQSEEGDHMSTEIGHCIGQLIKGNISFIQGIMSPLVQEDKYGVCAALKGIIMEQPAINFYHSIRGFSKTMIGRFMGVDNDFKKVNQIARCIQQGITFFKTKEWKFEKTEYTDWKDVETLLEEFETIFNGLNNVISEKASTEFKYKVDFKPFLDFLEYVRIGFYRPYISHSSDTVGFEDWITFWRLCHTNRKVMEELK